MKSSEDLHIARTGAGLSIRQVAQRAGVAASTVWRIEKGRLDPTVGMLRRLLRACDAQQGGPTREQEVSLTLGRLAAAALLRDPEPVLSRARDRVQRQLSDPSVTSSAKRWLHDWATILDHPVEDVVAALLDRSPRGYELRQNTPFTGLVSDRERLAALRGDTRRRHAPRSA